MCVSEAALDPWNHTQRPRPPAHLPRGSGTQKQTRGLWEVGDDGECSELGGGRWGMMVNAVSLGVGGGGWW